MRKWIYGVLLTAVMVTTAACGGKTAENPAPSKEEPAAAAKPFGLVVAHGADVTTLDIQKANDRPTSNVFRNVFEPLINQTETGELKPGLATEWKAVDAKTWEFKLRANVKFHNGETLKASDVKFTFDRLLDPATKAQGAAILSQIAQTEVVDELTVRIHLKQPFAPIIGHLSHPATSIMNEKAVKGAGEDASKTAIGTGPFKFVSHTAGSHVDLARFDEYWGEKAKADTVKFRKIAEANTRALELETGGVDIAYEISGADYQRMQLEKKVQLIPAKTFSTNYIGFNVMKAPFDKVEVRQAINHAINVDEIVKHVLLDLGSKATGPINNLIWGADKSLKGYEYDVQKAKDLLKKAGLENGFKTTIWTNDNTVRMKIAEVAQANLAKIGIEAEVKVIEWGTYLKDTADGKHDMFILGWTTVTGDADYGLYLPFHSSQFGAPGNRTFYKNEKVDAALEKGRTSTDEKERLAAYQEAQQLITADAPWLFLNFQEEVTGLKKGIENFVAHPAGHHRLKDVVKK